MSGSESEFFDNPFCGIGPGIESVFLGGLMNKIQAGRDTFGSLPSDARLT